MWTTLLLCTVEVVKKLIYTNNKLILSVSLYDCPKIIASNIIQQYIIVINREQIYLASAYVYARNKMH